MRLSLSGRAARSVQFLEQPVSCIFPCLLYPWPLLGRVLCVGSASERSFAAWPATGLLRPSAVFRWPGDPCVLGAVFRPRRASRRQGHPQGQPHHGGRIAPLVRRTSPQEKDKDLSLPWRQLELPRQTPLPFFYSDVLRDTRARKRWSESSSPARSVGELESREALESSRASAHQ